ncbi:MAG: transposase [Chitinophagaceae bacterium]|jgi:putative transposase
MEQQNIYLFVHVILEVEDHKPLLKNILRVVYVAWLKKTMAEKGVRLHAINGGEDHVHMLLQLHPAQNLMQVVRQIKDESLSFIGSNHFSKESFAWKEGYTAFSVSPGAFKQTLDYIERQEEYHQQKTFAQEMEQISKTRIDIHESNT